jgi:hypothetical protein
MRPGKAVLQKQIANTGKALFSIFWFIWIMLIYDSPWMVQAQYNYKVPCSNPGQVSVIFLQGSSTAPRKQKEVIKIFYYYVLPFFTLL